MTLSSSHATTVLRKVLESTTKESVEHVGAYLLSELICTAVAGPTAAILGAAAEALITALLEQTSEDEQKLNALIAEPLDTATAIVRNVLELPATDIDEKREALEDLREALRKLRTAYSYASRLHPEQCLLIRLYECIVLALMRGRENLLTRYLAQIVDTAAECERKAAAIKQAASLLTPPYLEDDFKYVAGRATEDASAAAGAVSGMAYANVRVADTKRDGEVAAHQLREDGMRLRLFEQFIKVLSRNRDILVA